MGVRENKVEIYLNDEIRSIGGITRKWVSPGRDGVPDRIVIYQGFIPFVEVKTVDGVLEDYQTREHDRLRSHGATVTTVYGDGGIDKLILHLLANAEIHEEYR